MDTSNLIFLANGGEMGKLTRDFDWNKTSLGSVDFWPQSLRTTLGILLNSKFPMFLFWGPDHICFYNDAYRPSLGNEGKHPAILGQKGAESWPEIWDSVKPLIDQVLSEGESILHEDQYLSIYRDGKMDDVYWTFSYSPVFDEAGKPSGVLVLCNESTDKIELVRKLEDSNTRYLNNILQTPNAMCIFRGDDFTVEIANKHMLELWGRKIHEVLDKPVFEALPEVKGQGLEIVLENVYTTGVKFEAHERLVKLNRNGRIEDIYVNFIYDALKEPDGTISGITAIANDVTAQVKARLLVEENDLKFRNTVKQVPLGIAILKGKELVIEMANNAYLEIVDKQEKDILGKPIFDSVPEIKQTIYPFLSKVYEEGAEYAADEFPIQLHRYGKQEVCYFNLISNPLREENGVISGVIITAYEVTESVNARHLLTESKNAFRNLIMESPIAMTILRGKNHVIEMANTTMLDVIWEKEESEVIGRPIVEVFPELKEQKYPELLNDVFINGKTVREKESLAYVEVKGIIEKFYLDYQYTPLFEKEGEISGVMVTVSDVTDKVEARKKVEDAEQRARLASEIAEVGTWDVDLITQDIIYSENLLKIFGFEKNAKVTRPELQSLIHHDDFHILQEAYAKALKTSIYKYESRIIKNDNSLSWIKAHGKIFFDENETPIKMVGTVMDITDEKNSRHVLMKNEEKFRLLSDSMPQHIWTSDALGNINYFNKSVNTYSGIPIKKIKKNGWLQIVHPEDRKKSINHWIEALKTGNDFLLEHRFLRHDNQYRWHLTRAIAQKDNDGNIQMWVGTSTDIQDQKNFATQLENQVSERTAELELKNKDLINMNIELQSFAYISSHDLQEPLRKIQTFASRLTELDEQNISAKAKTYLSRIEVSAKKMQTLIQDLLTYSRTNSAERIFVKVNLDEIAEEVISDFSERIIETKAVVHSDTLGEAIVMPFQIRQLLHNLIGNALKFSKKDQPPHVEITGKRIKGDLLNFPVDFPEKVYYHLKISDNGIGFDPEYKERIFEVFQRLNTETEFLGTGIGLAIVKKIVENHKGIIRAEGEKGKGAAFEIFLPEL
ncbi:PAS domain-containing protein [Flavobacterium reichenbachii]|uniref:histidine kinase n=1 Tax=Flavobacterium reichenbachii TaxID=362418 RepID=A0A085ZIT3_9FLAO|nr:PAS domain-containing protein [Flavobacterium reichenbachii]KFF04347.1 histidine kinase [Flavobacterium reichenbachii]OXB11665.1 PAS domain-containing sensor histidine kinase [Flavobacterium reichenbachii]